MGLTGLRFRSYVWTDAGPRRLPQAAFRPDRPASFAELAGARHRSLSVEWYAEGDRPAWSWISRFLTFDADGRLDRMAMLQGATSPRRYARARIGTTAMSDRVPCGPWDPTPEEIVRIEADLLPGGHPLHDPIPTLKRSDPAPATPDRSPA